MVSNSILYNIICIKHYYQYHADLFGDHNLGELIQNLVITVRPGEAVHHHITGRPGLVVRRCILQHAPVVSMV